MEVKHLLNDPSIHHHDLAHVWTFSYCILGKPTKEMAVSWEKFLNYFHDFQSFEDFYAILNSIEPPNRLPKGSRYYVFRKGIKPMWEDKANELGTIFTIEVENKRDSKFNSEELWKRILLTVLCNTLPHIDYYNGVEYTNRGQNIRIAIWTRKITDTQRNDILLSLKEITGPKLEIRSSQMKLDTSYKRN